MRRFAWFGLPVFLLITCALAGLADDSATEQTLARYARHGADVWARNPTAHISGEGQACISCHTSLPYALVEPLLPGDYPAYTDMIENIDRRILTWSENTPWYSNEKLVKTAALSGMPPEILIEILDAEDSRGTEAILNAVIRATHDAYSNLEPQRETRLAFEHLWNSQIGEGPASGRWHWIQVNLVPWEVADSDVWGAALACIATGIFPELAPEDNLELLRTALRKSSTDTLVSLHTRAAILWCDTELGGTVLEEGSASKLIAELVARQRANGGWALRELGPWPGWEGSDSDCCAKRELRSDAYATGFVAFVLALHRDRVPADVLDRAMAWIDRELKNPYPDGPRFNRHASADTELPEFRNNLYTNAGHMWAFLAGETHRSGRSPWAARK